MHATASYQQPRARTRASISTEAIIRATLLALALVAVAYFVSEIREHTRQTDQQALAGVR
ncbi:MAG: hypothetical protein KKF77_03555 [Proteobacteria bacterium]|nr:hypothetical protein [Pseudomonadota bacterium]